MSDAFPPPPPPPSPVDPVRAPHPYGHQPLPVAQVQPPATNTMAVLALVMAFVFPILGVVFGHKARKQIAMTGEGGAGMATAGLVISYISIALAVAWVGLMLVLMVASGA